MAGKYEIDAFLGAGAMGRVYRATQRPLDKVVAVKVLNANLGADAATLQRFLREAKAASRFDHPNSVAVFDFGIEPDGTAYIVMEYLRGESLDDLLQREGTLPAPRCVSIMSQVLAALAEAHDAGIVHRDIKPENIMLVARAGEDGDGDVVKVTDFGIAKMLDDNDPRAAAKLTATGITPGSPAYMSPEQAQAKAVDGRSDIYQCGVILFEMITGEIPFIADNAIGVIMKHINEPAPSARARNPRCPEALDAIIARAMEKSPDARFSGARAMRQALKTVAPDHVIPTGQISVRTRPRPDAVAPSAAAIADTLASVTAPRAKAVVAPVPPNPPASLAPRGVQWTRVAPFALVALGLTVAVVLLSPRSRPTTAPMPPVPVATHALTVDAAAIPEMQPPVAPTPAPAPTPAVIVAPPREEPTDPARRVVRGRPVAAPPVATAPTTAPVTEPTPAPVVPAPPPPVAEPQPAPVVVPPPAPTPAPAPAPTPTLRGVRGSLAGLQATGGISRGLLENRGSQAADALAHCVQRAAEAHGGAAAFGSSATVTAVISVRDRRVDEVTLSGSSLASGCREAVRGAFRGDLPQGEDAEYEVRLRVELEPQL